MSSKLQHEAKQLVGKNYGKASQTVEKLVGNIERIATSMASQGLQSIRHMKSKHVERFFDSLKAEGLCASTMANYATAMRTIAAAIGKENIVPLANKELGISREDRYQPKYGDTEKMNEVREALYRKSEWQGLAFDLQREFGLREKESLQSFYRIVEKDGTEYLQVEGAKGGRERCVEIETQSQRDVVGAVNGYIRTTGGKSLMPSHLTLIQALKKQSNDISRAGGTKANKANSHLWRHSKAQEFGRDGKSDKDIAEYLGHGREGVVNHYK